jgi:hypothetical protein
LKIDDTLVLTACAISTTQAEGRDYRLVSQRVWNQLSDRFGFDWEIARLVVTRGPTNNRVVEVYPVTFEVLAGPL